MNMGTTDGILDARSQFPTDACPSDLELDRFHVGELEGASQEKIETHLHDCGFCRDRRELRSPEFLSARVDADALFARIERGIEAKEHASLWERARRRLTIPQIMVPLAAAASVAVLFVVQPSDDTSGDVVRSKGSIELTVFRERDGAVEELQKMASFRSGDRVRFKVKLPERSDASQIMVVGVEASGKRYTYYPSDGQRSAAPRVRGDGALAGAIELDDYQGEEWLHLVHCAERFELRDIGGGPEQITVPKECDQASFLMQRKK